jgi:hypothetical protein
VVVVLGAHRQPIRLVELAELSQLQRRSLYSVPRYSLLETLAQTGHIAAREPL